MRLDIIILNLLLKNCKNTILKILFLANGNIGTVHTCSETNSGTGRLLSRRHIDASYHIRSS